MLDESPKEKLNNLLKMIDHKGTDLMKQDPYYEYYLIAKWAKQKGLIRKKTDEEISQEIKSKPWLKVNKLIRKNEQQNADPPL